MNQAGSLFHASLPLLLACVLAACAENGTTRAAAESASVIAHEDDGVVLQPLTAALQEPWGMDFLDDRRLLVTEKGGKLKLVDLAASTTTVLAGVPDSADVGQGGLLDVLVGEVDGETWIYLSYSTALDGGYTTRVTRGRLAAARLTDLETVFTARPVFKTKHHFGSRLLLDGGYLYVTVGDRGRRDRAQSLASHNGKVMRLYPDGRVPADNPFTGTADALPEIWSYGHRNPQGLARHPDGSIWVSEHGPQGGDELNRLAPGNNYGWPIITYGEEYGGGKIGEGVKRAGMEQPEKYYVPSIATSGMDFYRGDSYPGWNDSVLVGALALTHVNRVELVGDGLGAEHRYFADSKMRFRDLQVGPDGRVYVLAGNALYRIEPSRG